MKKVGVLLLFFFLFLITFVAAQESEQYHLKLLAVQEDDHGNFQGSDADLYLELKEGSGRVFLDTYPLTKMDTQISTRFAKEIACQHFKLNCENYDFIYTIKAKSNIIGGPSAGAAISALTAIALMDLDYDEKVTITGTINSGAIIGPVGGVKEKLEAAQAAGLKKVMIAMGTALEPISGTNETFNLTEYGQKNLSLEIKEVVDLDEVILELTGLDFNQEEITIEQDANYQQIMQGLKNLLCERADKIKSEIAEEEMIINRSILEQVQKKLESSENASQLGDYYSAASFCFNANIDLKRYYYAEKKATMLEVLSLFNILEKKVFSLEEKVDAEEIKTIADLQALMVVKERLQEVKEQIVLFNEDRPSKTLEEWQSLLAYSEERYFSALSWKQFFSMSGKKFVLDEASLKNSCEQKIAEAEERLQYVEIFIGEFNLLDITQKIGQSKAALAQNETALCLISAAQAKADADAILSSLGVTENSLDSYIESKSKAVERLIFENNEEGIFPILGYSYYQYAQTLKNTEKYPALVYLEYALEMSDLQMYFPEEKTFWSELEHFQFKEKWLWGLGGLALGLIVTLALGKLFWRNKSKKKVKKHLSPVQKK